MVRPYTGIPRHIAVSSFRVIIMIGGHPLENSIRRVAPVVKIMDDVDAEVEVPLARICNKMRLDTSESPRHLFPNEGNTSYRPE